MDARVETLKTDEFRVQHRVLANELREIEAALGLARAAAPSWRGAGAVFRRLLVLLEVDVAAQADKEEHAIYMPLRGAAGVLSPTLAACYREHHEIRTGTADLHRALLAAYSGHDPVPGALFDRSEALVALVREHMAREDEVLFFAAEHELPRATLVVR